MEIRLWASDSDGNELEAVVKLAAVPQKGDRIEIEHDSGTTCLEVVEHPIHTPAMGMREPYITVVVDARHERMSALKEIMRCADGLRTQDSPR